MLMIFSQFFILFHPFQKWTFLKMSNSKKFTKSFFSIFYHFFLVFYFIMINGNKIKNRVFSFLKVKLKKKREIERKIFFKQNP